MIEFNAQLRPNGSLSVRLSPLQGRQWGTQERSLILRAMTEICDDPRVRKIVVKDERGVIASLPTARNDYSTKLPAHMAAYLVELDDAAARLVAWRYLSSSARIKEEMRRHHQSDDAIKSLKEGVPSAVEVERMVAGEPAPFDCPVCGLSAETQLIRDSDDGVLRSVMRCLHGHETKRLAGQ